MSELTGLTPESVQSEIKRSRHKAELPMYATNIILSAITLAVSMIVFFRDQGILDQIKQALMNENVTDVSPDFNIVLLCIVSILSLVGGIGLLLYFIVIHLYAYYKMYAKTISYSIRVSDKNFPELYAKVKEFTRLLGLKKEPEVYITQDDGSINAFASWIPGKYYVRLNAEIVDLAYLENKDWDTVAFIMAHEFGHIYLHHTHMLYQIWVRFIGFVPVIGALFLSPLYSRTHEFSADRVAQALTGGKNQEEGMMLLSAGRHLYKHTDINDFIEWTGKDHNFLEKISRFLTNLVASHPIMPFRVAAILDKDKKSGRLL